MSAITISNVTTPPPRECNFLFTALQLCRTYVKLFFHKTYI